MLDAIKRKVDITFIIRKGENQRKPEDPKWLHDNVDRVYEVPNLHAKSARACSNRLGDGRLTVGLCGA